MSHKTGQGLTHSGVMARFEFLAAGRPNSNSPEDCYRLKVMDSSIFNTKASRHFLLLVVLLGFPCFANAQAPNLFEVTAQALADPTNKTILIAAHRGGYQQDKRHGAPENSVANIDVAVGNTFHVYETDIRQTSDGVFVIVHDATLNRETNGMGPVEKMTAKEVGKLKKKFRDGTLSKSGVATFDAMLAAGKNKIHFKPDLKPGVVDSFDPLARLIHKHEMADAVFLRTEYKHLWKISKLFADGTPKVEVMFKVNNADQVKKVHEKCGPRTIQINVEKDEELSGEKIKAIKTAVALGMLVETHVYGDAEQTERLIESGVRMFHTSSPDKTLELLSKRKARSAKE